VAAEILLAFSRFDPALDELQTAAQRPFCRYSARSGSTVPFEVLANVSEVIRFRASAALAEGLALQAFQDVKLAIYLAESIELEPNLYMQKVRCDLLLGSLQPIWEGLALGCWHREHLHWFQDRLGAIDLLADYPRLLRGAMIDQMTHWRHKRETWLRGR
jgi:hypothetical protein